MEYESEHVVHICVSECGVLFIKTNKTINIFPLDARVSEHTTAALSMQNSAKATRGTAMPLTCVHDHDGGKRSLANPNPGEGILPIWKEGGGGCS